MTTTEPALDPRLAAALETVQELSVTIPEGAQRLGLREQTLRSHIAGGRVQGVRIGAHTRIPASEIDRHRERQRAWRAMRRTRTEDASDE